MIVRLLFCVFLVVSPVFAQSWDDMAGARILQVNRRLAGSDKMIFLYPAEGKYWIITAGTFTISRPVAGAGVTVTIEEAPFAPYRDSNGVMNGCHTACLPLIRADAGAFTFFPIVGGYTAEGGGRLKHGTGAGIVQGQTMPIVVRHPNRLNIIVNGLSDTDTIETYTRLYVVERTIPH